MNTNTNITIDLSKGIDVMRGNKVLEHFEGENAYEAARKAEREGRGRYIRYWAIKEAEEA